MPPKVLQKERLSGLSGYIVATKATFRQAACRVEIAVRPATLCCRGPCSPRGATRQGPKLGLGRVPKEGDSCRAHAQIPITGHKRKSLSLSSPVSLTADTFKASAQPLVCPGASGSVITMCGGGGSPETMWHAKSPVQVRQWSWCSL